MSAPRKKDRDRRDDNAIAPTGTTRTRYEDDLYSWANEQVALLREGRVEEIDYLNIAEELGDVSSREYDKLESALAILLMHYLKWDHQPHKRSRSWRDSIVEHRRRAMRQLKKYPGLKSRLGEAIEEGYEDARYRCATETGIETEQLPLSCPYDLEDIMNRVFELPGERSA